MTPNQIQEADDAREAKVERMVQMHYRPITAARRVGFTGRNATQDLKTWLISRGRKDLWESLATEVTL